MSQPHQPWEPDARKMGNWTAMFEPSARGGPPPNAAHVASPASSDDEAISHAPDTAGYKPWTLQRGAGRPSMLIDFRRYDAKSGLWMGWQLAYAQLVAVDYIGDRMVTLDFGVRQVVIEGSGLDELVRHLQQGTVTTVEEFVPNIWANTQVYPIVKMIRRLS